MRRAALCMAAMALAGVGQLVSAPALAAPRPVAAPTPHTAIHTGQRSRPALSNQDWLGDINAYREAAGLSLVTDEPSWDTGLQHHLTYMAKTPPSYFTGQYASLHTENPASPYYTPDGAQEAGRSNLVEGRYGASPASLIDTWLVAPFHAVGILRPALTKVALAFDPSSGDAGLDVIGGLGGGPSPAYPTLFPGPAMTTNLGYFGGESPDPTETCGWSSSGAGLPMPIGLPLIALLNQDPVAGLSAQLDRPDGFQTTAGGTLCVVDDHTYYSSDQVYGPTGQSILQGDRAVFLIPRTPMGQGHYEATINQPGQPVIRWGFNVSSSGPFPGLPDSPTGVGAVSAAPGQATVSWTAPENADIEGITSYLVTTYDAHRHQVGSPTSASSGTQLIVNGLNNGTPYYFAVASVGRVGTGPAVETNSVTPDAGLTPPSRTTAASTLQYQLPNSDGSTWQDLDPNNLSLRLTATANGSVLLSVNADLWTWTAGYNQDIGICVQPQGQTACTLVAWKESGGFAGTFSPNAAFVETTYPVTSGMQYSVKVRWKTNKRAIGNSISAGAGPINSAFSPTRLTARMLTAADGMQSAVSTSQYNLSGSDGNSWIHVDDSGLRLQITPTSDEKVLLTANADAWTWNSGYNQDIAIVVTPSGGTTAVAGWKESGGFAGTFSPNAAYLQAAYSLTHGVTYSIALAWKMNRPAGGAHITLGAGAAAPFSPTRLTALVLPADATTYAAAVSTQQYQLPGSDGATWQEVDDAALSVQRSPASDTSGLVSLNADLWTSEAGINQDVAVFVAIDGGPPALLAWKESGGFAGTYSPNAAFLQTVYPMTGGHGYRFTVWWKANHPTSGGGIWLGAGPSSGAYSPTRLMIAPAT